MTIGFWDGRVFAMDSKNVYISGEGESEKIGGSFSNIKLSVLEKPIKYSHDGKDYLIKAIGRAGSINVTSRAIANIIQFCETGVSLNRYLSALNLVAFTKPKAGDCTLALIGVCEANNEPAAFKFFNNFDVRPLKPGGAIGTRHPHLFKIPDHFGAVSSAAINCILYPKYCGGYSIDVYDPVIEQLTSHVRAEIDVADLMDELKAEYAKVLDGALEKHLGTKENEGENENSDTTSES